MGRLYFIYAIMLLSNPLQAQKQDNVWMVGFGGGTQSPLDDEYGNMILDFSGIDRPNIIEAQQYDMNFDVTNTSICDSAGNLLFYTNGEKIYNKQHQLMQNGNNLVAETTGYGYFIGQGALILNKPGSPNLYYLLNAENYPGNSFGWKLYSNTIDMSLNNGLGKVIEKGKVLLQDSLSFGRITAIKHANGKDWWFFIRKLETNILYRGLIQASGITIDTVSVGTPVSDGGGQTSFSPDGKYYIVADDENLSLPAAIHIYDFDRCDGAFSNQRTHFVDSTPNFSIGIAVSPNSRFLYVFHTTVAYQYDLSAPDIFATETLIGQFDGWHSGLYGAYFLYAQTGPDGRIYIGSWIGTFHWHQVNFPNRPGLNCQFRQHSLEYPVYMSEGLPNLPNFRLGPVDHSTCDTMGIDNHPLANFRWEQEDTSQQQQITFTDLSAYAPDAWHWTFGDGATSQVTSPVHVYAQPALYSVCLIVHNEISADTLCRLVPVGVSGTSETSETSFQVIAYPNPFSSQLFFRLSGLDYLSGYITLFDLTGKPVDQKHWHGRHLEWDVTLLPPGLYFYELRTSQGVFKTGKIIKT